MALATGMLAFDLSDLLGVDYSARRTKVWLTTNVPGDTLVDKAANKVRLGSGKVDVNDDGTGSAVVWLPGADGNPASWQTYVHVDYEDRQTRSRTVRTFGPFTITATSDLADLIAEQEVPPTYLSTVTAVLDSYVSDAASSASASQFSANASAASAQEAADLILSDLGTSDGQMTAIAGNPASQFAQELSATIDAITDPIAASVRPTAQASGVIGYKCIPFGDSIVQGYATGAENDKWPVYLQLLSGGRVIVLRNAGIGGNTSAAALARIQADVIAHDPHFVPVCLGMNDLLTGVPFATYKTNMAAIVAALCAAGIVPVLCTIPPTNSGIATVTTWNRWLRQYADAGRLLLIDFASVLTNSDSGGYRTGYSLDGIHPQSGPLMDMADLAWRTLAPWVAGPSLPGRLSLSAGDGNVCPNAYFPNNYNQSGVGPVPSSWAIGGGTTGLGTAISGPDDTINGARWFTLDRSAGTDEAFLAFYTGGNTDAWQAGDRVLFGAWFRAPEMGADSTYRLSTYYLGEPAGHLLTGTEAFEGAGLWLHEFTLTGASAYNVVLSLTGPGEIGFAAPTLINLTKLGVLP